MLFFKKIKGQKMLLLLIPNLILFQSLNIRFESFVHKYREKFEKWKFQKINI